MGFYYWSSSNLGSNNEITAVADNKYDAFKSNEGEAESIIDLCISFKAFSASYKVNFWDSR
ncbi:hypothetical protein [Clostridium butyricum]|uniref:hypothetical protein n=1 Tax=Clostridium butyricum TaxID=1492 RepID=UPI0018A9F9BC|nr:hypothetical protein [Clostridium butyricum]MDB2157699.1 hypothetical protein [Clostridium butyricum]